MKKIKEESWVSNGSKQMIVRLYRGRDESGRVFCEWTEEESGDLLWDWFFEDELTLIS
jgi:hypothetical protein